MVESRRHRRASNPGGVSSNKPEISAKVRFSSFALISHLDALVSVKPCQPHGQLISTFGRYLLPLLIAASPSPTISRIAPFTFSAISPTQTPILIEPKMTCPKGLWQIHTCIRLDDAISHRSLVLHTRSRAAALKECRRGARTLKHKLPIHRCPRADSEVVRYLYKT